MKEWQENLILQNISDLIDETQKNCRNSWAIRAGLHNCFCILHTLDYITSDEFTELSRLANKWAIKWSK